MNVVSNVLEIVGRCDNCSRCEKFISATKNCERTNMNKKNKFINNPDP